LLSVWPKSSEPPKPAKPRRSFHQGDKVKVEVVRIEGPHRYLLRLLEEPETEVVLDQRGVNLALEDKITVRVARCYADGRIREVRR
jgi:hypothetical protein